MASSLDVLRRLDPAVPSGMVARAAAWSADSVPVAASRSASVVVLRERDARLETYLLHRHSRMAFAASMVVFPGGRLDPVDESGPDPLRACACRETAEETTVEVQPDDLLPWAHWVTPECEPRRYDTFFYVVELPVGQTAADVSGETDSASWATPASALAARRAGEIDLMPPTVSILMELAEAGSLRAVRDLAVDRVIGTVLPVPGPVLGAVPGEGSPGGWVFRYPGGGADER